MKGIGFFALNFFQFWELSGLFLLTNSLNLG